MFEQNPSFGPLYPMPVMQTSKPIGGDVNLFGDVTIIHNQQIDPMSQFNRQMELFNNRMVDYTNRMTQFMLESRAMELKQAEIDLNNRRLDMQQALLGNPENIPKIKQAIGVKTHKIANPFINEREDNIIDEVEYKISEEKEEQPPSPTYCTVENSSIYKQYVNLSKYFTKEYELNDSIKQMLMRDGYTNFMGEGGDNPVVIFGRYSSDTETINTYWRKIIRTAYNKLNHSIISKVNFITTNTPIILFMYDKSMFKADILCIIPTSEKTFLSINVPAEVENYRLCKNFRGWIEDDNPLILNKRINSAYVFAEPFSVDKIKFPNNSDKRFENVDIKSVFSSDTYSISVFDLHLKFTRIYKN